MARLLRLASAAVVAAALSRLFACSAGGDSASGSNAANGAGPGGAPGAGGADGGGGSFTVSGSGGSGASGPPPFPETCEEALATETSVGCTFYPLVLPGASTAIFIAANVGLADATVTLSNASGPVATQLVAPGDTYLFPAAQPVSPTSGLYPNGYVIDSDQPLQVTSVQPPTLAATNDASLVLPVQVLGLRHRIATINDQVNGGVTQYVAIVGVEDNTTVTFTLAQPASFIAAGGPVPALSKDNGPDSYVHVLNRLEVLVLGAKNQDTGGAFVNELTASLVESDKPVAVYSGNDVTYAPPGSFDDCCADLVSDSVPPTTVYGKSYAGVKLLPLGQEIDMWRFIGDHDDTHVTLSGDENTMLTLQAGEFADVLSAGVFAIESDQPVGLVHLMTSGSSTMVPAPGLVPYDCPDPIASPGDPAITFVYPTGNWLHRYVFEAGPIAPGSSPWCHDHITVVAEASAWASITLDGAALPAPTPIGSSSLSYAYVPVTDGSHELYAPPDVPVEVMVYGYSGHGSYLMPAGMGLGVLNPIEPPR